MHPFPNRWTDKRFSVCCYCRYCWNGYPSSLNILILSRSALLLRWADWYLQMWNDKPKFLGRFGERSHFQAQRKSTNLGWPAHVLTNHKNSSALSVLLHHSPHLLCSLQLCVSMWLLDEHLHTLPLLSSSPSVLSTCCLTVLGKEQWLNKYLNVWMDQWMKGHLDTHKAPKFEEFCWSTPLCFF